MNLSHIEHIGIAVKNLDEAIAFWEKQLGMKCYAIEEVKFIEKKGEGIHHMAIASTGLQENLDELAGKGVQLIDKAPRKGAEGLNIAFLHPKATGGVLLELCEDPSK